MPAIASSAFILDIGAVKRRVSLLIVLIPLLFLAVGAWTSPGGARVFFGSLFDFRKRQIFSLERTKALTLVKKEELPKEFWYPGQPDRLLDEATKDGKILWTIPYRVARVVVVPTISTSGWKGTEAYALYDESKPAPEGSLFLYDLSILSQETGVTIRHLTPRDMREPLLGEKN